MYSSDHQLVKVFLHWPALQVTFHAPTPWPEGSVYCSWIILTDSARSVTRHAGTGWHVIDLRSTSRALCSRRKRSIDCIRKRRAITACTIRRSRRSKLSSEKTPSSDLSGTWADTVVPCQCKSRFAVIPKLLGWDMRYSRQTAKRNGLYTQLSANKSQRNDLNVLVVKNNRLNPL